MVFVLTGCGVTSLNNPCPTFRHSVIVPNVGFQLQVTQSNITEERRLHIALVLLIQGVQNLSCFPHVEKINHYYKMQSNSVITS